jgi:hypothetical protein
LLRGSTTLYASALPHLQCSDTGLAGSATAGVSGRRPANGVARLGYASEPEIPRRGSVGVGQSDGPQSTIWRLWTQGSDVYLAPRAVARRWKISFHEDDGRGHRTGKVNQWRVVTA